jgi:hypothetical protein
MCTLIYLTGKTPVQVTDLNWKRSPQASKPHRLGRVVYPRSSYRGFQVREKHSTSTPHRLGRAVYSRSSYRGFQAGRNHSTGKDPLKLKRLSSERETLKPQNLTGWEGRFTPLKLQRVSSERNRSTVKVPVANS